MRVNATSFRAAALVRGRRGHSGTSLQFVQISAGAKDVLADVLARLEKVQALNRTLRASRIDAQTKRMLVESGRFRIVGSGNGADRDDPVLCEVKPGIIGERDIGESESQLIQIDLFG